MWEMLLQKGYSEENIFVLFADGVDYPDYEYANRYKPGENKTVTDYAATRANVDLVFEGLANGEDGFPKVKQEDFLFVWTFDHGGASNGNSYICLIDGNITDVEFSSLTNQIDAHKKVFWMQQCRSGGFIDDLQNYNTYIITACGQNESARRANDNPIIENEFWNGQKYNHGEFNFHIYSATVGQTPAYVSTYNGEPYSKADVNNDNIISVIEAGNWEITHENQLETPLFSDMGNIGLITSLEYPTIINSHINDFKYTIGIASVPVDVHLRAGNSFEILSNSKIHFLENSNLFIDENATLTLNKNVTFTNETENNKIKVYGTLILKGDISMPIDIEVMKNGKILLEGNSNLNFAENTLLTLNNNCEIETQNQDQITVNGNLTVGNNVIFTGLSQQDKGFLNIRSSKAINISNAVFQNFVVTGKSNISLIDNSFTNSFIKYKEGNVTINNNSFDNSYVQISYGTSKSSFVEILNSNFSNITNSKSGSAITIEAYSGYKIFGNTLTNNLYTAISIINSGYHPILENLIAENTISGNHSLK